ncbi:hypothetical protein EPI10_022939 [Gossypium australe]|uniref:Uncharacterized protein n=1 Tax=Gossypium australe TaxID=47621 RepID=A0A5B6VTH7_9ROSI|nr:hypothetical protein EPI10_022939 [Gossypium australe]
MIAAADICTITQQLVSRAAFLVDLIYFSFQRKMAANFSPVPPPVFNGEDVELVPLRANPTMAQMR